MEKYFFTDGKGNTGLKVVGEWNSYKVFRIGGQDYEIRKEMFGYRIRKISGLHNILETMEFDIEPFKRFNQYKVTIRYKEVCGRIYRAPRYLDGATELIRFVANALINGELGEDLAYNGEKMVTTWEEVHTKTVDFLLAEANRCEESAHDDMFYAGQKAAYILSLQIMGYEMFGCNSDDLIVGKMVDSGKYEMRRKVVRWEA